MYSHMRHVTLLDRIIKKQKKKSNIKQNFNERKKNKKYTENKVYARDHRMHITAIQMRNSAFFLVIIFILCGRFRPLQKYISQATFRFITICSFFLCGLNQKNSHENLTSATNEKC